MTLNHDKTKKEKFHKLCKRNVSSSRSLQWINSFVILCKKPATIKIPKYESNRHGTCDESTIIMCLADCWQNDHYSVQGYSFLLSGGIQDIFILDYPIAWLEDSLKSTMVSSLEVRNRVIDTISEITKIPKLKFQIGRQKSFQAMFTLCRIVKRSVTESVPDNLFTPGTLLLKQFLLRNSTAPLHC